MNQAHDNAVEFQSVVSQLQIKNNKLNEKIESLLQEHPEQKAVLRSKNDKHKKHKLAFLRKRGTKQRPHDAALRKEGKAVDKKLTEGRRTTSYPGMHCMHQCSSLSWVTCWMLMVNFLCTALCRTNAGCKLF